MADAPATGDAADRPRPATWPTPATGDALTPTTPSMRSMRTVQPVPCGALRTLSSLGPFTDYHARRVLCASDRRLIVLGLSTEPGRRRPGPGRQ